MSADRKLPKGKSLPLSMPEPPAFLLTEADNIDPASLFPEMEPTMSPVAEPPLPSVVDKAIYQSAVDDRKKAEETYAEIYSDYVDVATFNDKLLRTLNRHERFQRRARVVYNNLKDQVGSEEQRTLMGRIHLLATEKTLDQIQLENDALRVSVSSHEEAFQQVLGQLKRAEYAMQKANDQFRNLSEEYDNRGVLLAEADRKIREYLLQMDEAQNALKDTRSELNEARETKLLFAKQLRDLQLREAGIETLNKELADALDKSQKQNRMLEDKIRDEREESRVRIALLEQELTRFRENKRAEILVDQSREVLKGNPVPPTPQAITAAPKNEHRDQWNDFYGRWSHIIDELTTQSTSLKPRSAPEKMLSKSIHPSPSGDELSDDFAIKSLGDQELNHEALMSEIGDLEIL